MIKFQFAHAKSANANVGKEEITVSFTMILNEDNLEAAKQLAIYIGKGPLLLTVNPKQMSMELKAGEAESQ